MNILETIPVNTTPDWCIHVIVVLVIIFFTVIYNEAESDLTGWISVICFIAIIVFSALTFCGTFDQYDHDEYIVDLNGTNATELLKEYEIVKNYSDVWEVKRK